MTNHNFSKEELDNLVEYSPYGTSYDTREYKRGKMYTYTTPVPYVGLVVTVADNGFGHGISNSYIVTKLHKNKTGEVKKVEIAEIYSYDPETMTLKYVNSKYKNRLSQSGNKGGTWVRDGDNSSHMIYYVSFGDIGNKSYGYDK